MPDISELIIQTDSTESEQLKAAMSLINSLYQAMLYTPIKHAWRQIIADDVKTLQNTLKTL